MSLSVHETDHVVRVISDRHDTFRFEREGEPYPFVDVSFALTALHGRTRIITDGPYKNVQSTSNSKAIYRQRPELSPNIRLEASVSDDRKQELAARLASLIFEINDIKEIIEQE